MKFTRDRSKRLADDARNPGALNWGLWAERYGAKESSSYEGTSGNKTAIFATRAHGIAALIELIMNMRDQYGAVTVRDYIVGSGGVPPSRSYSGGQSHYADSYIAAIRQKGVDPDETLDGSLTQIMALVDAHSFAEGSQEENTDTQFMVAFALLQERSPNIAGTELQSVEIV